MDPAVRYSATKHRTNIALELSREVVESNTKPLTTNARQILSDKIYAMLIPFVDNFAEDRQLCEAIGEENVLALWARAYSIVAWSRVIGGDQTPYNLLVTLLDKVKNGVACAEIREAASFALSSIIGKDNKVISEEEIWHIADEIYPIVFDSNGEDIWLVGAVAQLSRLSLNLKEPDRSLALSKIRNLYSQWTERCYLDRNAHHATYCALSLITKTVEICDQLDYDLQVVFTEIMDAPIGRSQMVITRVDLAVELLTESLPEAPLICACNGLISLIPSLDDHNEAIRLTYVLRKFAVQTKQTNLLDVWRKIRLSSNVIQLFWFSHIVDEAKLKGGFKQLSLDAQAACEIYQLNNSILPDEVSSRWVSLVITMSSVALLRDDSKTIEVLDRNLILDNHVGKLSWLMFVSIVCLGRSNNYSLQVEKWARKVLSLSVLQSEKDILHAKKSCVTRPVVRAKRFCTRSKPRIRKSNSGF